MQERVLVFKAELLSRLGEFQGYTLDVEKYLPAILDPDNNSFAVRHEVEIDPRYKQLIPYVVLRYRDTVFSYVRGKRSGETRLVALRSIGLGGHIEPTDRHLFASNESIYLEAAEREVTEEVQLDSPHVEHIVGLINDNSNGVGRVHFGIVHVWDLLEPKVRKNEQVITKNGFSQIKRLRRTSEELETWSQITLDILENPLIPPYHEGAR